MKLLDNIPEFDQFAKRKKRNFETEENAWMKTNNDLQNLICILSNYYKKKDKILNVNCLNETSRILKNQIVIVHPENYYEKILLEMFDKLQENKKIEIFQEMMTAMEQLSMVITFLHIVTS